MTEPNITPLARRLAEENGIDWRTLEGTGPEGNIVERDILAFLAKVMAGEVELPPQPEDEAPPEEVPDLSQVQEALAREGVGLEDVVPGITSETSPQSFESETESEEDAFFELDFDEEPEPAAETPPTPPSEERLAEPSASEEGAAFPSSSEEEGWQLVEEEPEPPEKAPAPWQAQAAEAAPEPEEVIDEFSWEAAVEGSYEETAAESEAASEGGPPEEAAEPASWVDEEEELPADVESAVEAAEESASEYSEGLSAADDIAAEPATSVAEAAAEEPEAPEQPQEEPWREPQAEAPAETVAGESEPAVLTEEDSGSAEEAPAVTQTAEPAATAAAVFPAAYRRAVSLSALDQARKDLSTAWKREVPTSLLLFRAVDRALAELEVPIRAVMGRFDGEDVSSFMVYPAENLRALYDNLRQASEPTEGLVVIDLAESPYAEVLLPEKVMVSLGYAGMPADTGLLSVSGELPTDRTRFLERVAFYLERPILLA